MPRKPSCIKGCVCVCVRARVPRRKQLPLAVSASHPGLTAARNMRPLETSVLGRGGKKERERKKDTTAHKLSEPLLSLRFSLSPARPDAQRRKKAVCLCPFTHSASNRSARSTHTHTPPANLTLPLNHHMLDFPLSPVCKTLSLAVFSQFDHNLSAIPLCVCVCVGVLFFFVSRHLVLA